MRLLHFDNNGKLILTDFNGETIPPYAILSHRWGDDEVRFEDLVRQGYDTKTGYRKIKFCAEQAAEDGLQYFWIDTCCINKWDRAELSEAINAMFHWYRNATKCYVFLSDVSSSLPTENVQQNTWEASFRASEWFTRGWTLQELIAPDSVEFFSSEGYRLGSKSSLEQLVHDITSIPVKVLRGCPLEDFSPLERIAWAQPRVTKEPEDHAYCLLGILGVLMPTSYGEGKDNALTRLYQELEATSAPSIIPYARNTQFVGQELELIELETKLFKDDQTTMIAISGAGGTGKSQLALELAYRTKEANKNCSIFWINASDIDGLHQSYLGIAQKLAIAGWDNNKTDVKQLVKHYLTSSAGQWLLIFDNVDDLDLPSTGLSTPSSANLADYVPRSAQGSIVFTTTEKHIAETLAGHNIVELRVLKPDSAQRMFEYSVAGPFPMSERQEMRLLLKELSYLPLAISQAAAYIKMTKMTLKDYRSHLVKQKRAALERSDASPEDKLQVHETINEVIATLLISLEQICLHHTQAAVYLFLAVCVNRKDIPLEILGAPSTQERDNAVRILQAYALVTKRPADSAFDVHRLVHFAIREWLCKMELLIRCVQKAIKLLLVVFPDDDDWNRSMWRRLLPHARHALSYSQTEQQSVDGMDLMWKCAMTLFSDGRYDESEEYLVQVMKSRKTKLGTDHPDTLASMHNLATIYSEQGRWEEAEQLQIRVMETHKTKLGVDHPHTLLGTNNLALTYGRQGRWEEAEQLQIQVVKSRKIKLGTDHPDTLASMNNLATTYSEQGRWEEAEQLQMQVIKTYKTKLGADHPDTLISISNLAVTCGRQGRREEAEQLQMQVMKTYKTKLGADHPDTLISTDNLAMTYSKQGRWEEAEQLQMQVMKIYKTKLGADHPDTLTSMNNLAWTRKRLGHDEEAISQMEECVQRLSRVAGVTHPHYLTAQDSLQKWIVELSGVNSIAAGENM